MFCDEFLLFQLSLIKQNAKSNFVDLGEQRLDLDSTKRRTQKGKGLSGPFSLCQEQWLIMKSVENCFLFCSF